MKKSNLFFPLALILAAANLQAQNDSWLITGNTGIQSTNYLGTKNNSPLHLKAVASPDNILQWNEIIVGNPSLDCNFQFHSSVVAVTVPGIDPNEGIRQSQYSYRNTVRITNENALNGFSIKQRSETVTLRQEENAPLHIFGFNETGLTIKPNGYIGIGTELPTERLFVSGNVKATGGLSIGGDFSLGGVTGTARGVYAGTLADFDNGVAYLGFNLRHTGENNWYADNDVHNDGVLDKKDGGNAILSFANGDMYVVAVPKAETRINQQFTNESLLSNTKLILRSSGLLQAREVKVTNEDWPDFVFSGSYQLPSLCETEQYILDNGHLPNIPSAAEVEADGVNLGEMNALLLQKVEELTLYIIDLQKQINELKGE